MHYYANKVSAFLLNLAKETLSSRMGRGRTFHPAHLIPTVFLCMLVICVGYLSTSIYVVTIQQLSKVGMRS